MDRRRIDCFGEFFWTVVWTALLLMTLSVSQALAQKGKPKPPPPPPPAPIVTTQEIVYWTSTSQGVHSLVVANRDGTNKTVIHSGQWYNVPSWHPGGDEIIFSSAIPETGIWSIKLNRNSPTGVSPPTRIVPQTVWGGLTTPVWSPLPIDLQDGRPPRHVIAYGDRPAGKMNNDIFIWDPETASSYNLTQDDNHYESYPTWSPDGSQLVIVHTSATGDYPYDMKLLTLGFGGDCQAGRSVCETQPQESLVRRISPDPGSSVNDCYVPAGATEPSPLCGPTTALIRPKFGNTGQDIVLSADGIWTVPLDAPETAENLFANMANFPSGSGPSWSPDDSQIIYRGSVGSQRSVCGKKNWQGIARINSNGAPFPNGCYVEFLINGAADPSWWRFAP